MEGDWGRVGEMGSVVQWGVGVSLRSHPNRDLKEVQSAEEGLFQAEEQQVQTVLALLLGPELPGYQRD